jgi:UDP-N-acetyl-D-glucosamine dehydrogenase
VKIAVVALGKIGLPLAVQYARSGHSVTGVDIDTRCVAAVNNGTAPFPGEAHLDTYLKEVVEEGSLTATEDYGQAIPTADAVVVVVPLLVDVSTGEPEFRWMDLAVSELARNITPNTLIIFETTLPVGTTRGRWKPMIDSISGLSENDGVHLVFSPERVLTGRVFSDLRKYPKLIGALTTAGATLASEFYEAVLQFDERPDLMRPNGVWDLGSAEAAEMAKLAETTYRDVNIALANQFALHAQQVGVDVYSVIEASNSQPYSHIHRPGVAVGGHCIPVYPRLYLNGDPSASVVRAAREANEAMPSHTVDLLAAAYGRKLEGARVAVLGATYRGGVKETAMSGVFELVRLLRELGARPMVNDPMYSPQELADLGFACYEFGEAIDAAIVQTDHVEYRSLTGHDLPGASVLVDGRLVTNPDGWGETKRIVLGDGSVA